MNVFAAFLISGLLSLGVGQGLHLNVLVAPAPGAAESTTAAVRRGGLCDIVLSFFDGQSNQLKSQEFTIDPGQSASLEFDLDDSRGKAAAHGATMVYGTVTLGSDSDPSACPLIATLDVTDPNGRTTAALPLGQAAAGLSAFGAAQ